MGRTFPGGGHRPGNHLQRASFGVFVNSFLKTHSRQVSSWRRIDRDRHAGNDRIFAMGAPGAEQLGNTVSLVVPQGWAVRGLMQSMNGEPLSAVLLTALVMLIWSAAFFVIGVLRFNRRYV